MPFSLRSGFEWMNSEGKRDMGRMLMTVVMLALAVSMGAQALTITGAAPSADTVHLSGLDRLALGGIYWLLGTVGSFCVAIALGGIVGAIRSLLNIFRSRTAWFALITFCIIGFLGINFAVGVLPIAGNLGDMTGYRMQSMIFVGAVIPGLFTWIMPVSLLAMGSGDLSRSQSFRSYAFVWGAMIYYFCGLLGLYIVFAYLTQALSPKMVLASLLVYPLTFLVAPIVMVIKHGIWLPIALHFGGLFAGGFVMSLGEEKEN